KDTNLTIDNEKTHIISNISEVERYYSENKNSVMLRFADEDTTNLTEEEKDEYKKTEEIVDKYYSKLDFDENGNTKNILDVTKSLLSEECFQVVEINNDLQDFQVNNIKNSDNSLESSNKLFFEEEKNKLLYSCYYCDYTADLKIDYEKHIVLKQSGRLAYPDMLSIEKEGLVPQGKPWEVD
ncbi:MAG: hypothetical protein L0H53_11975, partial [Candidatus Nitrosocosmicus sp.]|nr:hypothetical protein [Candidatus Nitrosocosmicus sp.]